MPRAPDRWPRASALLMASALGLLAPGCGAPVLDLVSAGPLTSRRLEIGGALLDVELSETRTDVPAAWLISWITRAATMVSEYCGGFPVPALRVRVVSGSFGGVAFGQHVRGRRVRVLVGEGVTARGLSRDWVMVHEMLHAAFPRLARRHSWMREGLSTYLETVIRARAGIFDEREVWRRWTRHLRNGVPRPQDQGLDRTRTWGATYWGGAVFWLLVDVELRARTGGRRSIRDLVRGVLADGGDARSRWSIERVLRSFERATGARIVTELYEAHALRRGEVDLAELYARLGVVTDQATGEVRFDDGAPLAGVRASLSERAQVRLPLVGPD